ncbi:MAG: amidohydrolase family protein [Atopobiaceae bacterium]|jgi:imidazolonepropionase-like amidohydrolase|nr:amidohydrolase family protein [Atopobiaceae bacterium]MCI2172699.1 amidohydrolase family protein [Atopobiaceae bacterium]MCI2207006.1 amidohydrolase family protein [Atopobiaceae bacterium]
MLALTHATLLDGTEDMAPKTNQVVLVDDDGKIKNIGADDEVVIPVGARVVDLDGKYLMPGLVNMHVHFCGSGKPRSASGAADLIGKVTGSGIGRMWLRSEVKKSAINELMSGVTTVRGVGDPVWADVAIRERVKAGKVTGPRMLCSGWGVTPPHGHGVGLIAQVCETPDDARALVREIFAHGCDLVKLFITGGVFDATVKGEPGVVRMDLDMAKATVDEAHKLNLPCATHVESADGVLLALKAGVDTIEHGAPMTDEIRELFLENGVGRASSLTTTISPAIPLARMDPEKTHSTDIVKFNADMVFNGIVECSKQALEAGIPVGLGTDSGCPYVTHYDMWREVVYFHELVGVSNAFALHTATLGNARLLHVDDVTGSVEVGKSADLIVTAENPLDDLEALRHVETVVMAGKLIEHPRPKHLSELDPELDEILHAKTTPEAEA